MSSKGVESTSKKSKACMVNDARDRLSELPDEILVHILSFLPILDAVGTLLIRRFGNLWTLVSSLIFEDYKSFVGIDYDDSIYHPDDGIDLAERISRFARFVRNVLMRHKGFPVNKFLLHLQYIGLEFDHQDIDIWIKFAIDRQLKELEICHCNLPLCVFTSQFLVQLKLSHCYIEGLTPVQMGSLRKLSLNYVEVSNEMFEKIIFGCPSLQELVMRSVPKLDKVRIIAPNIKKLDLDSSSGCVLDCPNLKILKFLNFHGTKSDLPVVDISSVREVHINSINQIDKLVNKICKAEVVNLSYGTFSESNFKEINIPETNWKFLQIASHLNEDQLIGIFRVLRSSPHLEELIIVSKSRQKVPQNSSISHDHHMLPEELSFPCKIPQLKTVTMLSYEVPGQGLLQLAEFLLKSCVNLENMVILSSMFDPVEENKILKQLRSFPRASANVRVICEW